MSPILNACDYTLQENSNTLPDVSGALLDYFQPMNFNKIVKSIVNFKTVETSFSVAFQGVWQPSGAKQIRTQADGQQAWGTYVVHADPSLILNNDDVVMYQGAQYRVTGKLNYSLYGYNEYYLIQDWVGAGPS